MNTLVQFYCRPRLRVLGAMLAVLVVGLSKAEAASRWATLEAIHKLENPRNSTRPGPCGELGAYQFRESTWRMHTKLAFGRALERDVSDQIAVKHYEWLRRGLERAGIAANAYNIALAWNGGLTAAINGRAPAVAHDYAARAANLAAVYAGNASLIAVVP